MGVLKFNYFIGRESTSVFKRYSGIHLMMLRLCYFMGYRSVDMLICQTDFMKEQLVEGIPGIASGLNIQVLHNPINLEGINNQATAENIGSTTSRYIVSAGRLIPEKGYDLLIKAYADILPEFPDTKLLILGEGNERAVLQSLVEQLGITDRVMMPGRVNNVYPYFKGAELCVVSSRVEGFPNVLLQMMSQNNNVVSTTCAGGIDKIPALSTCVPGDAVLLAQLMGNALGSDDALKADRGKQFQAYLEENSLSNFMKKIDTYVGN
jgi:glycosyltransferase involved in cell wall biosynthesis